MLKGGYCEKVFPPPLRQGSTLLRDKREEPGVVWTPDLTFCDSREARLAMVLSPTVDPFATYRRAGRFFADAIRFPCRRRGPPAQSPVLHCFPF